MHDTITVAAVAPRVGQRCLPTPLDSTLYPLPRRIDKIAFSSGCFFFSLSAALSSLCGSLYLSISLCLSLGFSRHPSASLTCVPLVPCTPIRVLNLRPVFPCIPICVLNLRPVFPCLSLSLSLSLLLSVSLASLSPSLRLEGPDTDTRMHDGWESQ